MDDPDTEAAKEVHDLLRDQISSILIRKRQREEAALEQEVEQLKSQQKQFQDENEQLKRENDIFKGDNCALREEKEYLTQRLASSMQASSQANQRLERLKQNNTELNAYNQAQTIKTLEEQVQKLNGEKHDLQSRLEKMEQHEVAFKTTVANLKMKLSLALEDLSRFDSNLDDNTLLEVIRYINNDGDHSVIEINSESNSVI